MKKEKKSLLFINLLLFSFFVTALPALGYTEQSSVFPIPQIASEWFTGSNVMNASIKIVTDTTALPVLTTINAPTAGKNYYLNHYVLFDIERIMSEDTIRINYDFDSTSGACELWLAMYYPSQSKPVVFTVNSTNTSTVTNQDLSYTYGSSFTSRLGYGFAVRTKLGTSETCVGTYKINQIYINEVPQLHVATIGPSSATVVSSSGGGGDSLGTTTTNVLFDETFNYMVGTFVGLLLVLLLMYSWKRF